MAEQDARRGAEMKQQKRHQRQQTKTWYSPINIGRYDRTPSFTPVEWTELVSCINYREKYQRFPSLQKAPVLERVWSPIEAVLDFTRVKPTTRSSVVGILLQEMYFRQISFWGWTRTDWISVLGADWLTFAQRYRGPKDNRQYLMAVAYLLGGITDLHIFGAFEQPSFARKVFGQQEVDLAIQRVSEELVRWGYGKYRIDHYVPAAVCEALLRNQSPVLEDLTPEVLDTVRQGNIAPYLKNEFVAISRVLASLGYISQALTPQGRGSGAPPDHEALQSIPQEWLAWVKRWKATSTLAPETSRHVYQTLFKVGRWLAATHPDILTPDQWTRELAAEYVAAVDRMRVGQWTHDTGKIDPVSLGKPLAPRTKNGHLAAMRAFFRDCQEWEWIPRRFDPGRSFATPRSIRALIAPDPRALQDDAWAKLLWAGLNLTSEDLPIAMYNVGLSTVTRGPWYPLEMMQAMVIVWLFAGLRSQEFSRLRLGCVRWQREDVMITGTEEVLSKDAVCMLEIPTNKTGTMFTKPVDRVVGEAVEAWERIRPEQPLLLDTKTSELVQFLFCYRGYRVGKTYINDTIIPMLCRKCGMAEQDARGDITSHRARSTIATQLFNAREPLSLFELQEWLGHRSPASTQYYAKIAPTKLAKSYEKAGYFGRNVRTIGVLIDQEVVKSGAAATGEPWRFYDLGHGYCLYEFFDQCPHRMACAKCAFYCPKGSTQAQLLEGKANLLHMLQEIPLSDEERAAVEDGIEAMEKLCQQLADVPTPAGPTPNQLSASHQEAKTIIPVEKVRRKR
jgi:integrase